MTFLDLIGSAMAGSPCLPLSVSGGHPLTFIIIVRLERCALTLLLVSVAVQSCHGFVQMSHQGLELLTANAATTFALLAQMRQAAGLFVEWIPGLIAECLFVGFIDAQRLAHHSCNGHRSRTRRHIMRQVIRPFW